MAAILSALGLYGGNKKMKLPLRHKTKIHPPEGHFGNLHHSSIGWMPGDRNLLSFDTSLAIPTRVLHFKVSGNHRRTPVRSVLLESASRPLSGFW
jgi:hypothetical protein